jgi:hypothetical protein
MQGGQTLPTSTALVARHLRESAGAALAAEWRVRLGLAAYCASTGTWGVAWVGDTCHPELLVAVVPHPCGDLYVPCVRALSA